MRRTVLIMALSVAVAAPALGQAVTEWRTAHELPVAMVEVAGGDLEHLAALVPPDAVPPVAIAGLAVEVRSRRAGQLWSISVPALLVQPALADLVHVLAASGAAAVVALGPVPFRELEAPLAELEGVPVRPLPRRPCVVADGAAAALRGSPDRVDLALAIPGPADPRADLLPALLAWTQIRLAASLPEVRVEEDLQDDCSRMVVRLPSPTEHPRIALRKLRQQLAALATSLPAAEEVARALVACQARAVRAAVEGGPVARSLAERLALGGHAAGALATPLVDAATLGELARDVLGGHPGSATIVEGERRPQAEPVQPLDNGVVVAVEWVPGEIGVVALALGGVCHDTGHAALATAAAVAARQGYPAAVGDFAGVPTLAVAAPATAITDVMERVSDAVASGRPAATDGLEVEAEHALGLSETVRAESVSVALALPPEVDVGPEAVGKFFGSLPPGGVQAGAASGGATLNWTVGTGIPSLVAIVDLPPTAAGMVACEVLRDRLALEPAVRTTAHPPPGRLVLMVASEGGPHVPALDGRLAALWKAALRAPSAGEATAAARRTLAAFYGDLARATARTAASAFLPVVPSEADLLGLEAREVGGVLAALPPWERMMRSARGQAPPVPTPPAGRGGVRKSRPPKP